MKYLALFLSLATAYAAVDGTVTNRTTGKPQAGVTVTLSKLSQAGPEAVATAKTDAQGRFTIDKALEQAPYLLQAAWQGITYNRMLPPGTPAANMAVEVYDASSKPGAAQVAQHMVLLEPGANGQMNVSEAYLFENTGTTTYNDPASGTLKFFVPEGGKETLRVNATEPQGLPIETAPTAVKPAGTYKLDFPIKPGESRIDITYTVPYTDPGTFAGMSFYKGTATRLIAPAGVTLQGDALKQLGQEPSSGAMIYEVAGGAPYKVAVAGTGSLRSQQAADSGDNGPQIQQILPPQFEDRRFLILGVTLALLAMGFVLLYRKGSQARG
jgi:hypothetical protein